MEGQTIKALEYAKIINRLVDACTFAGSKELAAGLSPSANYAEVIERQRETTEARNLWRLYPQVPLGGIRDLRAILVRIQKGGLLEPGDLLNFLDTLEASRKLSNFFRKVEGDFPILKALAGELKSFPLLEQRLKDSVASDGTLADTASPALKRVRQEIKSTRAQVRERLESMVRSAEVQKYLQENLVTTRQGRFVLPVRQEYRHQVPGLVHDQSGSGATLFIEPMAVVELNNRLRELLSREQAEIEKVLRELSDLVRSHQEELTATMTGLSQIDLILAKGTLSISMDAREVYWVDRREINLKNARHPLLKGEAVPLDIELGTTFDVLVITGPNTGGKTVALKTVGLLSLMGQAGLHLPVGEGTSLGVFKKIFADIGDEQSIEQSLSTFSSHMTKIVRLLNDTDSTSLVLLDELGAGTDPAEGSALARAILEELQARGSLVIATTHYSELKTYAYSRPRVENASVEFDPVSLKPTYRLKLGLPGQSNAFEISRRLGLPDKVVNQAREFMDTEEIEVSELISGLTADRHEARETLEKARRLERETQEIRDKLIAEEREFQERKADILARAYQEANLVVQKAKDQAGQILAEFKARLAEADRRVYDDAAREARERLKEIQAEVTEKETRHHLKEGGLKQVKLGQGVWLPSLNQRAEVISLPDNQGNLTVQAGVIKISVNLRDLREANQPEPKVKLQGEKGLLSQKSREISPELDLRGTTAEEALLLVDKYLDDASLVGLPRVRLIHGKGTGALRKALQEHLKGHPQVKSFRNGGPGEGGLGVTVAELE